MRNYSDVLEMTRETSRELKELGITVPISHMQDKQVAGDEEFFTKELIGYSFRIVDPTIKHDEMIDFVYRNNSSEAERVKHFIEKEFGERVGGIPVNPGESHKERFNVWEEFLESDGRFSYQYAERLNDRDLWQPQYKTVIDELKAHPDSRQGIVQIFNYSKDNKNIGGQHRIPCSMHYQYLVRNKKVHSCYVMRSNDFYGHFSVDIIIAAKLQMYIAKMTGYEVGSLTYFSGSLHAYQKDFSELVF